MLAWHLCGAVVACGGEVTAPPAASASSSELSPSALASAASEIATSPTSEPAVPTSGAPHGSASAAAPAASVGPIAQMKARAATHPSEYLSKPIKVDGVYVRTTTRIHGGGEHPRYRFIVVMIADAPGAEPELACEMLSWTPPSDLQAGDPVTIEGHGSAMAGLATGYDLRVSSCRVSRR
jgi:hypothetical protein